MDKPQSVLISPYQSQLWDALCADYEFKTSDMPALAALCLQYDMIRTATESIQRESGEVAVLWNDGGEPKARPEIAIIERANAQVAALRKQLGIHERVQKAAKQEEKKPAQVSALDSMRGKIKVVS